MDIIIVQLLSVFGLFLGLLGMYLRWREVSQRPLPIDRSPEKGDPDRGVAYALTRGMLPWAKESTRLHAVAYLRGVGFHIGIFATLAVLFLSPFRNLLPPLVRTILIWGLGFGALLGATGGVMRIVEVNLRRLSTPDDHFSVWVVTVFMASVALAMWREIFTIPMYIISAVMFVYIPIGKIRHCIYFFFSRSFFGRFVGRRGVLPHPITTNAGVAK